MFDAEESMEEEPAPASYARPASPISAFVFQHRGVFDLARAFDYAYDAVDAVIAAQETIDARVADIEVMTKDLPVALARLHNSAREQLVVVLKSALDPQLRGSAARQLHNLTCALKERLESDVEKKANEQIGRLAGLEETVSSAIKKSMASIAMATATLRAMSDSLARQQAELNRTEARLAKLTNKLGLWSRIAGYFA